MEIINKIQESILANFGNISGSENFYLTGGTALSQFYLKHRQSNDLDFFTTDENFMLPFAANIEKYLENVGISYQRRRGMRSFVELFVENKSGKTLIHMAVDAAFRFEPLKEFPGYPGLKVDNLTDIASNKLLALFGRAALRDFIDIYFLINRNFFTKGQLTEKAKQKDPGFDLYWLGVAFERINTFDSTLQDMLLLTEPLDFKEISVFFNKWREEISGELK